MNSRNWNKLVIKKTKPVLEYFGFIHTEVSGVVEKLYESCM